MSIIRPIQEVLKAKPLEEQTETKAPKKGEGKKIIKTTESRPMPKPEPIHVKKSEVEQSAFSATVRHTKPGELPEGIEFFDKRDKEAAREIHTDQRGKHLAQTYTYKGKEVAREVATRTDVIPIMEKSYRDRITYLERRLHSRHLTPDEHDVLQRDLTRTRANLKEVQAAKNTEQTWVASGSYRRILEKCETVEDAHNKYVPGCVNLRTHQVIRDGKVTSSINRSGAISDYRHGDTNLAREMKLLKALEKCDTLAAVTEQQWDVIKHIAPGLDRTTSLDSLRQTIREVIQERQWVLENQALQDLTLHFATLEGNGTNLGAWLQGRDEVSFSRVSMLDGMKSAQKDGNFVLNEKNQMLDMKAIYALLDGKDLVFDGHGPFLDDRGRIHMPFKCVDEKGAIITKPLDVTYFNISTQGHIKNEGPQKKINAIALEKLTKKVEAASNKLIAEDRPADAAALRRRLDILRNHLEEGIKDGFDTAEEAAMLLKDLDVFLSINCFSGKDRTGNLAVLITHSELKVVAKELGLHGSQKKAQMAKWGRQALSKNGTAARIVEDNTGYKALKISPVKLKVLHKQGGAANYLLGMRKRFEMFAAAGATFVTEPGRMGEGQVAA